MIGHMIAAKKRQMEESQDDGMLEQMLSELDCAQHVSKPKRPKTKCGNPDTVLLLKMGMFI